MTEKQVDPKNEQLIQQKYTELYQIDMNMRQLQQQIEAINQQIVELENILQSLEDLKKIDKDAEATCMFTPGIFVKAKITDNQNVLLNVGGGTIVEKPIDDAKDILQKQSLELQILQDELLRNLDHFTEKANKLKEEFQTL